MGETAEEMMDIFDGSKVIPIRKSQLIPCNKGRVRNGFSGYDMFNDEVEKHSQEYTKARRQERKQIVGEILEKFPSESYFFAKEVGNKWLLVTDDKSKKAKVEGALKCKQRSAQSQRCEALPNQNEETNLAKKKSDKLEKDDAFDEYLIMNSIDSKTFRNFVDSAGRKGTFYGDEPSRAHQFRGMMVYDKGYNIRMFQGIWTKEHTFLSGQLVWKGASGHVVYYGHFSERENGACKRHGSGSYYIADRVRVAYVGEWEDDFNEKKNGTCRRHGRGWCNTGGGVTYEGDWEDDLEHGKGKQEGLAGCDGIASYEGSFAGGLRDGIGTMQYTDGSEYKGDWHNNVRDGYGTMKYADGSEYKGDWHKNVRDGYGTMKYASGSEYKGNWHNDVRHGDGRLFSADGSLLQDGTWKEDKYLGFGSATASVGSSVGLESMGSKSGDVSMHQRSLGSGIHSNGDATMRTADDDRTTETSFPSFPSPGGVKAAEESIMTEATDVLEGLHFPSFDDYLMPT